MILQNKMTPDRLSVLGTKLGLYRFSTKAGFVYHSAADDLSAAAISAISNHGFAILPAFFTADETKQLRSQLKTHTEETLDVLHQVEPELPVGSVHGEGCPCPPVASSFFCCHFHPLRLAWRYSISTLVIF